MCVTSFQRFEPQRRRFTNFHHHHSSSSLGTSPSLGVIFDTISVKVHWEQWCRWNCDLRVINAQNQAFSVISKASPLCWKSCAHNYAHYVTLGSRCRMASNHRVANFKKKNPVLISKDEAPSPLSVVWPLFIPSLLFHLSRALLGAWRFSLFRSIYSSFHNRLDLIREPAFYWVFYFIFPIYPCLFHHMQKWKSFVRSSLIDSISWPHWVRVWGWASYRFLPFIVFFYWLALLFLEIIVHLRCTSEGGSLDV